MTNGDFARAAVAKLAGRGWVAGQQLLKELDVPVELIPARRALLKRLHREGILDKQGTGKFYWRKIADQHEFNAFKKADADASTTPKTEEPEVVAATNGKLTVTPNPANLDEVFIGGDTFPHRIELKQANGHWDKPTKQWRIEKIFLPRIQHLIGETPDLVVPVSSQVVYKTDEAMLERVKYLEEALKTLQATRKVDITIKQPNKPVVELSEHVHPVFEQVMFHIGCGDDVMLVGPKGCGKTTLAEQIAKAMGLDFGLLSMSGGVTEGKLFGRLVPNITNGKNEWHPAAWAQGFENGGVRLLDEVDAGDPNVLLSLNAALSVGKLALDRSKNPLVTRHKEFVCLAAANTWGNGADRRYVGRNQQDSAFTERFVQIAMGYDEGLELVLGAGHEGFVAKMHHFRKQIAANRLERELSTRFIKQAVNWLNHGKDEAYCLEMLFAGWREDEIKKVKGA